MKYRKIKFFPKITSRVKLYVKKKDITKILTTLIEDNLKYNSLLLNENDEYEIELNSWY